MCVDLLFYFDCSLPVLNFSSVLTAEQAGILLQTSGLQRVPYDVHSAILTQSKNPQRVTPAQNTISPEPELLTSS